jgi:hypothetical protein
MSLRRGSSRTGMTTHILETTEAEIAYDVRGQLPTPAGRPPLFMIGQPMNRQPRVRQCAATLNRLMARGFIPPLLHGYR